MNGNHGSEQHLQQCEQLTARTVLEHLRDDEGCNQGGHHVQSEAIIETVFEHHVQPLRALEARNQLDAKGVVDLGHYLLLSEDMVLLMIGHHLRLRDHLHGEDAARGAIFDELSLRPSRVHQEVIKGSSRGSSGDQ